jgi:putative glutamine amidotransferase
MASRPRIGITGARRTPDERASLDAYVEAVQAAGGEAVLLLPGSPDQHGLDSLDGLVLTGGRDIDPGEYGEPPQDDMDLDVDRERDALELPLARAAVQKDIPVLGICRGIQVLNVAMGGTLYQDIILAGVAKDSHQQRKFIPVPPFDAAVHRVAVASGGQIRTIAEADALGVNTFHHQAIKEAASGLIVTARSVERQGQGVIEAVEDPHHRFLLGVQWHPERMWRRDGAGARLFAALVRAARRRAA